MKGDTVDGYLDGGGPCPHTADATALAYGDAGISGHGDDFR